MDKHAFTGGPDIGFLPLDYRPGLDIVFRRCVKVVGDRCPIITEGRPHDSAG